MTLSVAKVRQLVVSKTTTATFALARPSLGGIVEIVPVGPDGRDGPAAVKPFPAPKAKAQPTKR